jgi:hypothetical protein
MAGPGNKLRVFERRDVPVFGGGECLPLTMYIAKLARLVILPALQDCPPEWSYEDRVLVMLAPSLRQDVAQFHEGHGADMVSIFRDHQIEHMDRTLVEELRNAIARLSPDMAAAISRGSEVPHPVES